MTMMNLLFRANSVGMVIVASLLSARSLWAQGTMLPATSDDRPWQRSFDQGIGSNFLVFGFGTDRGQLGVSNSLVFGADQGYLYVEDPVRPVDGGAFSVVGIDTQLYTGDIHMSATINPAGLPVRDPVSGGGGTAVPPPEVAMGLLAGGNFGTAVLYAGGLDFDTGKLFLLRLDNATLYPCDSSLAEDSITDRIPDFRSRSFFIEFDVENRGPEILGFEHSEMRVSLYEEEGGPLLSTLTFQEQPMRDGYTGVFASFRDISLSPDYPTLVASFDDVRLVPEPVCSAVGWLVTSAGITMAFRRRPSRD